MTQSNSTRPTTMITLCSLNTTLNYDKVSKLCALLDPQW